MTKLPSEPVRVDRLADVPRFVAVTMHSPTTAPDGSFTVPTSEPNVDCAVALLEQRMMPSVMTSSQLDSRRARIPPLGALDLREIDENTLPPKGDSNNTRRCRAMSEMRCDGVVSGRWTGCVRVKVFRYMRKKLNECIIFTMNASTCQTVSSVS